MAVHRLPTVRALRESTRRIKEPPPPTTPPISNARIAMAALLVAETMFFSGLIGAYLIFRVGTPVWPPPNLPHLPLAINTSVLIQVTANGRCGRFGGGHTGVPTRKIR